MDSKNSTAVWVLGIIVVAAIVLALWRSGYVGTPAPQQPVTDVVATSSTVITQAGIHVLKDKTVAQVVAGIPDSSSFSAYLSSTGVSSLIAGKGPYTVFVPTNEAFAALAPGTISGLTAAQKKRLIEYHIISGRAIDIDAVSSGSVLALSKDPLNFSVNLQSGIVSVGSAYMISQYKAGNGIVYLVSSVILPPEKLQ